MLQGNYEVKAALAVAPEVEQAGMLPALIARVTENLEMGGYEPFLWWVDPYPIGLPEEMSDWVALCALALPTGSMN